MKLKETYDEIAAMIPRYSWEIMDEEQRDQLMEKVVLPRYGDQTADGVVLKATAWGRIIGATADAIDGRVRRLRRSRTQTSPSYTGLTETQKTQIRGARSALKRHPDAVNELLKDPAVLATVVDALPAAAGQTRSHATVSDSRRHLEAEDYLLKVQTACEAVLRKLPDYRPTKTLREEAEATAEYTDAASTFLRNWADGIDIADEAMAWLEQGVE